MSGFVISSEELNMIFSGGDISELGSRARIAQEILAREGIKSQAELNCLPFEKFKNILDEIAKKTISLS